MPEPSTEESATTRDLDPSPSSGSKRPEPVAPKRANAVPTIALALGVVATCLAAYAAFKPAKDPTPTPAASQSAVGLRSGSADDAKKATCTAVDTVRKGITLNTNLRVPGGPADAAGTLAVAANARLSLSAGGQYLLAQLDPSAAADLRAEVQKFAALLLDIGANATAGIPNTDPAQAARLKDADATSTRITALCR